MAPFFGCNPFVSRELGENTYLWGCYFVYSRHNFEF